MGMRLDGAVALVIAGADGIGWGIANRLLRSGAAVLIADIDAEAGAAALKRAADAGFDRVAFTLADATNEAQIASALAETVSQFGGVSLIVANAGGPGASIGGILEADGTAFDGTVNLTMRSAFIALRVGGVYFAERRSGTIVLTGSIAATMGGGGPPIYAAAKAGMVALCKAAAVEFAPLGVRVNTVSPGFILTPKVVAYGYPEERAAGLQPWHEAGLPEHVGDAVVFLASDEARFIVGADLIVDGGAAAQGSDFFARLMGRTV